MGYTKFGKIVRKEMIDHDENLLSIAKLLGVTTSFVSAVLTGGKSVPDNWVYDLSKHYNIVGSKFDELYDAYCEDKKTIKDGYIKRGGWSTIQEIINIVSFENIDAYVDELTQLPEDFYKMLLSRLSVKGAKLYATTNPDTPNHWVKIDIIDNEEIDKKVWTFTLEDNVILKRQNEEYFEQLKKEYQSMGGVFYERFILGLWVIAEGLIYKQFANHTDLFMKDEPVDEYGNKINFMIISIGIDYGATEGETEFKATGITSLFKEAWTIDEMKLKGLYSPDDIYKHFIEFYKRVVKEYGKVTHCYADYGALGQVLTFGLNQCLKKNGIPLQVQDCIKGKIIDRIYMDQLLFAQGRRFLLKKCKYLKEAYEQAVWDDKHEDERLDDGTTPIDDLDASEYSMFPFYDKLIREIGEKNEVRKIFTD